MSVLLDTATFLWAIAEEKRLSLKVRSLLLDPDVRVFLSSVSAWEISIKYGLGKLALPEPPERYIPKQREAAGFESLELSEAAATQTHKLPSLHRDPFDRMLISQAIDSRLSLATCDEMIARYPVSLVW